MLAIIRTRWHTRPLSRRARRRSSAAPGSLRKKYAGIVHPPNMVRLHNHSTTSRNHRKSVLFSCELGVSGACLGPVDTWTQPTSAQPTNTAANHLFRFIDGDGL